MPSCSSPESLAAQIATAILLAVKVGALIYGSFPRRKRL